MDEEQNQRRLRFDWFNHLTMLSLIILGGIIGFVPRDPIPFFGIVALVCVAFGGATAASQSKQIVNGKPLKTGWRWYSVTENFALWSISLGAGVFLGGIVIK